MCSLLALHILDIIQRVLHRPSRSHGSDFNRLHLSHLPSQRCVTVLVAWSALCDYHVCRILQARMTRSAAEKEAPRRRTGKDKCP
jgi:hypothetical protein